MVAVSGLIAAVLAAVIWWDVIPRAKWRYWQYDVLAGLGCLALAAWAIFALGFWAGGL